MIPITWPEFANIHPFAPADQRAGYDAAARASSKRWLCEATGYAGVSLQPNAGSQGEYAGLLAIRAWHASRGEAQRNDLPDPRVGARHQPGERADGRPAGRRDQVRRRRQRRPRRPRSEVRAARATRWPCVMITYPSTYGVFERAREGAVRDRAPPRRPRLRRRRQHERAGRRRRAGRVRRRRQPPQPAQDLLHPARRRRPGRRPGLRGRRPGAVPARPRERRRRRRERAASARSRRHRSAMPRCCRSAGCTCA